MKIRLTHQASQQLISAYGYLQGASGSAATAQIERIFGAIDLLEQFPLAGRTGGVGETREMVVPRTPFIVAYKIKGNEVQILAVLHASRRWPDSL